MEKNEKRNWYKVSTVVLLVSLIVTLIAWGVSSTKSTSIRLGITHVIFVGHREEPNNSIIISVRNNYNNSINIKEIIYVEKFYSGAGLIYRSKNVSFSGNPAIKSNSTTVLTLNDVGWFLIENVAVSSITNSIKLVTDENEIYTEYVSLYGS
jgi:hypothetical protein